MRKTVKRIGTFTLTLVLAAGAFGGYGRLNARAEKMNVKSSVNNEINSETVEEESGFSYEHDPMENPKVAADILPDKNAVYGYVPSPEGSLAVFASYDFSDPEVVEAMREERVAYHEEMNQMLNIIISMKEDGESVEAIARAVSKRRNEIRLEAYEGRPEELAKAKQRNLEKYGDENGPTAESLYEKYGSWELVAEKSFSPNLGADAVLGLYDLYYNQDTEYIHELVISTPGIKKVNLRYRTYVQKKKWMSWVKAGIGTEIDEEAYAGTTDDLRMETIQMQLSGIGGAVKYRAYVQKNGWTQWATTADKTTYAGTKGESIRIEMIQLKTTGEIAERCDIYYRSYCEKFGWLGWAGNNEKSGSAGYARKLEAFQVQLVPKGSEFDKGTEKRFYNK